MEGCYSRHNKNIKRADNVPQIVPPQNAPPYQNSRSSIIISIATINPPIKQITRVAKDKIIPIRNNCFAGGFSWLSNPSNEIMEQ